MNCSIAFVSSVNSSNEWELLNTLEKNAQTTESMGLNGILIFSDGNIFEVIEGDENLVTPLFEQQINQVIFRNPIKIFKEPLNGKGKIKNKFLFLNTNNDPIQIKDILNHLHISKLSTIKVVNEILKALKNDQTKQNIPFFLLE